MSSKELHPFLQYPLGRFRDPADNTGKCWFVVNHHYCGLLPNDSIHQAVITETCKAPERVRLAVCVLCGRDDRHAPLRAHHFHQGGLCHGRIETVDYMRIGAKA